MEEETEVASHTDKEFVDELNYLLTVSKHPRTLKLLQDALEHANSSDAKRNGDGAESNVADNQRKTTTSVNQSTAVKVSGHTKSSHTSWSTTRITDYGWDQSETFVKLYITSIPGVNKINPDEVVKEFTNKSMMVQLNGVNGRNYSIVVSDLCGAIIPDQSSVKVKGGNVTISLRKETKDTWPFLTGREKKLKDAREAKPPKVDKDEDPGVGLMKLMKQMYDEGDDEMKRTIAKAWHESQEKRAKGAEDAL